jgi:hypothetical protein
VIETENRLGGEVRIFFLKKRLKETIIQKKDERGESFLVPEIEVNTMPISIIFFLLLTRFILNVIKFYLFSVDSAIKKKGKKAKVSWIFSFCFKIAAANSILVENQKRSLAPISRVKVKASRPSFSLAIAVCERQKS